MCQSGNDLILDILLDVRPGLAIFGGMIGKEFSQVARFNIGHNFSLLDCVIIIDD